MSEEQFVVVIVCLAVLAMLLIAVLIINLIFRKPKGDINQLANIVKSIEQNIKHGDRFLSEAEQNIISQLAKVRIGENEISINEKLRHDIAMLSARLNLIESEMNEKTLNARIDTLDIQIVQDRQSFLKTMEENVLKLTARLEAIENKIFHNEQVFVKAIEHCVTQLQGSLQHIEDRINKESETAQNIYRMVDSVATELKPITSEVKSWRKEPLARRRDMDKKKIVVLIDFENVFISLCKMKIEIVSYPVLKKFLIDPEGKDIAVSERIILFTNKSRWRRKDYYDKSHNITQAYAKKIKNFLKQQDFRIIEPESNVDIPLTLLAMAMAERGEVKEFTLVANDGTYAGLVSKLSDLGCVVSGILVGEEASGDLITCYNELGFKKYHVKSEKDFEKFGSAKKKENLEEDIAKEDASDQEDKPVDGNVESDIQKKLNKWGKKYCFTPVRQYRCKYLQYLFDLLAQPCSPTDMRAKIKAQFPETNGFCRYTLGKILIKSENLKESDDGILERTTASLDVWLQKAEKAWLEIVIGCLKMMKTAGKITDAEFTPDIILNQIMNYNPEDAEYPNLITICNTELQKQDNAVELT